MKIAILTSPNQWFIPYAKKLSQKLKNAQLFFDEKEIKDSFDILFILSYHRLIGETVLKRNRHNIVVHASDLPQGKGWAPMFWQILEGKNEIPFTMFEAADDVDNGDVYMKSTLVLDGSELNKELRKKQAEHIIQMCLEFVNNYQKYIPPSPQKGEESFYPKRGKEDSRLEIDKSLREQFNLLRIVDNEEYPAFFYHKGKKYILKIEEANNENR